MNRRWLTIIRYWLLAAFAATFTSLVAYFAVQQVLRRLANDPQIQMAEDAAFALEHGRRLEGLIKGDTIEIGRSIAPFLIAFSEAGVPVASNAVLDGAVPKPPAGVFCSCGGGENRVTWQPRHGVRIASVIVHHSGAQPGFVLAGRSLRESERRTDQIGVVLLGIWGVTLIGSFIAIAVLVWFAQTRNPGADAAGPNSTGTTRQ